MGLLRLLKKAKYKFFPIKEYINGIHYNTDYSTSELDYILVINIIKGPYENSVVGFETVTNEGEGRLILKTRLIVGDYNFTSDKEWCIIASDIFQKEFESAMENYKKLREEVLNDEDDRTYYFEESAPQRTVYTKGDSVPKKRVLSRQKRKIAISGDSGIHSKVQPPANHGSDSDIFGV